MAHTHNPFSNWRKQHPHYTVDVETNIKIGQWVTVSGKLLDLFIYFENEIEPWLRNDLLPAPDLVSLVAGYGYSRIVTGDWKQLPIEIPEDELEDWKENSGLVVPLEELWEWQAGVAGSVAEMLHANQSAVVQLINHQLEDLYAELNTLIAKPIREFAPTQWDEDLIGEEETGWEIKELDRIFEVYEKLWCFEQGIEELRMLMITEDAPEFHVPNKEFYDALLSIDSHRLLAELAAAEPKLKEILKLWSSTIMTYTGRPYEHNRDDAPEVFWWRHWNIRSAGSSRRKPQRR